MAPVSYKLISIISLLFSLPICYSYNPSPIPPPKRGSKRLVNKIGSFGMATFTAASLLFHPNVPQSIPFSPFNVLNQPAAIAKVSKRIVNTL